MGKWEELRLERFLFIQKLITSERDINDLVMWAYGKGEQDALSDPTEKEFELFEEWCTKKNFKEFSNIDNVIMEFIKFRKRAL